MAKNEKTYNYYLIHSSNDVLYFIGNPYASDFIEDPGLRKQIFNATMPDGDDGYRLETGINLREYDMCDEKFKTKLATSVAGYKKVSL